MIQIFCTSALKMDEKSGLQWMRLEILFPIFEHLSTCHLITADLRLYAIMNIPHGASGLKNTDCSEVDGIVIHTTRELTPPQTGESSIHPQMVRQMGPRMQPINIKASSSHD